MAPGADDAAARFEAAVCRLALRLQPPAELDGRDELVRQRMERAMKTRWRNARVAIFGSAGTGLRVGAGSDVDLCIILPDEQRGERARARLAAADVELAAAAMAHPEAARQSSLLATAEREERMVASDLKAQKEKAARLAKRLAKEGGGQDNEADGGPPPPPAPPPARAPPSPQLLTLRFTSASTVQCRLNFAALDLPPPPAAASEEARLVEVAEFATAPPPPTPKQASKSPASTTRKRRPSTEAALAATREAITAKEARLAELRRVLTDATAALSAATAASDALATARAGVTAAKAEAEAAKRVVFDVAGAMRRGGGKTYSAIEPIRHARTPVVRCCDTVAGVDCDVVVNNRLAICNTALLRRYAQLLPAFRDAARLVKAWASKRGINKAADGYLSSYGHVLLLLHYLQAVRSPPLLPDLQHPDLTKHMPAAICEGIDVRFEAGGASVSNDSNGANGADGGGSGGGGGAGVGAVLSGYFRWIAKFAAQSSHRETLAVRDLAERQPRCRQYAANAGYVANAVAGAVCGAPGPSSLGCYLGRHLAGSGLCSQLRA